MSFVNIAPSFKHFVIILGLLQVVSCTSTNAANIATTLNTPNLSNLPDDLILKIILEQVPHEVPTLMKLSVALRERMLHHSLFQSYLVVKFQFPLLKHLPFSPDLFKLVFRSDSQELLGPQDFFRLLCFKSRPTPFFRTAAHMFFDYFESQSIPGEMVNIETSQYSQFLLDLILTERSLEAYSQQSKMVDLTRNQLY